MSGPHPLEALVRGPLELSFSTGTGEEELAIVEHGQRYHVGPASEAYELRVELVPGDSEYRIVGNPVLTEAEITIAKQGHTFSFTFYRKHEQMRSWRKPLTLTLEEINRKWHRG